MGLVDNPSETLYPTAGLVYFFTETKAELWIVAVPLSLYELATLP